MRSPGLPGAPEWLSDEAAEAPVGSDASREHRAGTAGVVRSANHGWTRDACRIDLDSFAIQRAATLEEQHNRVRTESSSAGRASVSAHQPVDVLGAYVLLPA